MKIFIENPILITSSSNHLLKAMMGELERKGADIDNSWNEESNPDKGNNSIYTHIDGLGYYVPSVCTVKQGNTFHLPKDWDKVMNLVDEEIKRLTTIPAIKPVKIPSYVRCIKTCKPWFTEGKIYQVSKDDVEIQHNEIISLTIVADDEGDAHLTDPNNFKNSTKAAYDKQQTPKSKFKVGDKVFTLSTGYHNIKVISTITRINGDKIHTDLTGNGGWYYESDLILANEEGILRLARELYPIGTAIKCAKDGEFGITTTEVKYDDSGDLYSSFSGDNRNQYVYLPSKNKWAVKSIAEKVTFGDRIFEVDILNKTVTIPDYGNVGIEQVKQVVDWVNSGPTIKGYKATPLIVAFGCHEGKFDEIEYIYNLMK